MQKMHVAIDCDDAGSDLKSVIVQFLRSLDVEVTDLDYLAGNAKAMYPEIGYDLALKIRDGAFDRGILICGTGLGMAMIANKVEGVYAGVCHDVFPPSG